MPSIKISSEAMKVLQDLALQRGVDCSQAADDLILNKISGSPDEDVLADAITELVSSAADHKPTLRDIVKHLLAPQYLYRQEEPPKFYTPSRDGINFIGSYENRYLARKSLRGTTHTGELVPISGEEYAPSSQAVIKALKLNADKDIGQAAHNWLDDIQTGDIFLLRSILQSALRRWLDVTQLHPKFCRVRDVVKHSKEEQDEIDG